jgi:hypothetical protein
MFILFGLKLCDSSMTLANYSVPVGCVVALKVLDQHLVHSLSIWWVAATVTHGASSSVQILPHHHGHFPDT